MSIMNQNNLASEVEEEQEILEALSKGTLKRSKTFQKDISFAKKAAENFSKKNARLNIWISSVDSHSITFKYLWIF